MTPEILFNRYMADPCCDMRGHMEYLRHIAKGTILEIGVRGGASTSAFLCGVEKRVGMLYSVDINPDCGKLFSHPQWRFMASDSANFEGIRAWIGQPLDILFIDGDHSYEAVKRDLLFAKLVKDGGLILLHDVRNKNEPGVEEAVAEFMRKDFLDYTVREECFGLGVIRK
jgi:predicted O-methyltransferase YrrM